MRKEIVLTPIGFVRGGGAQPIDDGWDSVEARIELDGAQFGQEAMAGLGEFSHVEVVFHFDRAAPQKSKPARAIRAGAPTGLWSASSPSAARTAPTALA